MNIFVDSQIMPDFFRDFRKQIEASKDKKVDVYISTIGGNVDAAIAAANYIEGLNASGDKDINTHLLSNADSSGTILFLAPKDISKRHIVEGSKMFIHDPSFSMMFDVNNEEAEKVIKTLGVYKERIISFYMSRIEGLSSNDASALMTGEETLTANRMVELNIVNDIQPNFNIAAIKSKSNIINNMSLFGKKKPINQVALKQGDLEINAVHEGDMVEGVEIQAIGTVDALNGEYETTEQKITIESGKVKAIEAIAVTENTAEVVDVAEEVAAQLAPVMEIMNEVTAQLATLKGEKSTHKTPKANVDNKTVDPNPHTGARKRSQERQEINAKKVSESKRNLNVS